MGDGRRDEGGKTLHLLGIVSFFSSHGSVDHLSRLLRLAKQEGWMELYLHTMLGRRGSTRRAGSDTWNRSRRLAGLGVGRVAPSSAGTGPSTGRRTGTASRKTYRLVGLRRGEAG